ncbi:hypothetical protein RI054_02g12840 [Pseudoscourfieldia marina]
MASSSTPSRSSSLPAWTNPAWTLSEELQQQQQQQGNARKLSSRRKHERLRQGDAGRTSRRNDVLVEECTHDRRGGGHGAARAPDWAQTVPGARRETAHDDVHARDLGCAGGGKAEDEPCRRSPPARATTSARSRRQRRHARSDGISAVTRGVLSALALAALPLGANNYPVLIGPAGDVNVVSRTDVSLNPANLVKSTKALEFANADGVGNVRMAPQAADGARGSDLTMSSGAGGGTAGPGAVRLQTPTKGKVTLRDETSSTSGTQTETLSNGVLELDAQLLLTRCLGSGATCPADGRTITSARTTGSNAPGVDLALEAGAGTGAGNRGSFIVRVPTTAANHAANATGMQPMVEVLRMSEETLGSNQISANIRADVNVYNSTGGTPFRITQTTGQVNTDGRIIGTHPEWANFTDHTQGSVTLKGGFYAEGASFVNNIIMSKAYAGTEFYQLTNANVIVDFSTEPFSFILPVTLTADRELIINNAVQGSIFHILPFDGGFDLKIACCNSKISCANEFVTFQSKNTGLLMCKTTTKAVKLGFDPGFVSDAPRDDAIFLYSQNPLGGIRIWSGIEATMCTQDTSGPVQIKSTGSGVSGDITLWTPGGRVSLRSQNPAVDAISFIACNTDTNGDCVVSSPGGIEADVGTDGVIVKSLGTVSFFSQHYPSTYRVISDDPADDLSLILTGATDSSVVLKSEGIGIDAVRAETSAGGILLTSLGNSATGDIDLHAVQKSVKIRGGEGVSDAVYIHASTANTGGIFAESAGHILVKSTGAVGASGDITVLADVASVNIVSNEGASDAVKLHATAANTGGILGTSAGHIKMTTTGAAGGAGDITLDSTLASVQIIGREGVSDAVYIHASTANTGGIFAESAGHILVKSTGAVGASGDITVLADVASVNIVSNEGASDAVKLHATAANTGGILGTSAGHIKMTTTGAAGGAGDITLDSTLASVQIIGRECVSDAVYLYSPCANTGGIHAESAGHIRLKTTGAANGPGDITIESTVASVNIIGHEAVPDAVYINTPAVDAGGIHGQSAGTIKMITTGTATFGDITLHSTLSSVNMIGCEEAPDAIRIHACHAGGGIDIDAGTAGIDALTTGPIQFRSTGAQPLSDGDVTLRTDFGSANIMAGECVADAVRILTECNDGGGIDIDSGTGGIHAKSKSHATLTTTGSADPEGFGDITVHSQKASVQVIGGEAAPDAVRLLAEHKKGGIDVDAGLGGIDVDSQSFIHMDGRGVPSHFQVHSDSKDDDLILEVSGKTDSSVIVQSDGTGNDAVKIQATHRRGGVDIYANKGNIDALSTGQITLTTVEDGGDSDIKVEARKASVRLMSGEPTSDAIRLNTYHDEGGIDIDAGRGGFDVESVGDAMIQSTRSSVNIDGGEQSESAVSITASHAGGGVSVQAGTYGSGAIDMGSGTGGISLSSTGALVGGFYGALVTSYGSAGGIGDVTIEASLASVNIDGGENIADAVSIEASASDGGIVVNAGVRGNGTLDVDSGKGGIDVQSAGGMDLRTLDGRLVANSTNHTLHVDSNKEDVDALVLRASGAAGGIDVDSGTGGIDVQSMGAMDLRTMHGDITVNSTDHSVLIQSVEDVKDAISMQASHPAGGIGMESGAGGIGLLTTGDIAVQSTLKSVSISGGDDDTGAVSIVATSFTGGVAIQAGTHGSGTVDIDSGTGGMYLSSTGAALGSFYGAAITSYGVAGATGDITLEATLASVNIDGGEADAAAVSIEASSPNGGIKMQAGVDGAGSMDIDSGYGGIDVQSMSTLHLRTLEGQLTINSTDNRVYMQSKQQADDAVKVHASSIHGGVHARSEGKMLLETITGDLVVASEKNIIVDSKHEVTSAVSILATAAGGGIEIAAGTHGSGEISMASGLGGTYLSSTGAYVGGFYGAIISSYGNPGGTGDISLHSTLASVNVQAGEADAAAVSIEASHDKGGVTIQAATHAAGSVTVGAGTGGVSVMSTGKVDVASTQNSASAVHVRNTHASGGVTIEGVGTHASTVLLTATAENGGVTMQAPEDGGSVTVSSSTGGVSVGSSGTVAVDSTQASSSSVKITASHAEGGVLVGAQDTVAIESAGAKDGAVSITATSASGGVSVQGGTHGSGSVEVASGTGGTYMSSTGALVGGFYGAVVTSYGSPGGTGDITLHSSIASLNLQAGEADAAAVSIEASHDEGGVTIRGATHAAGSVTVGAGTGGVSVMSTGKVDVASAQNSASAVHVRNTHASGGVTIEGVGTHASTVLLTATAENGGVTMQAPEDGGSVTVSSSTGGVSVGSSGTVAVDSTQASSSSVKITASHAEGGVLVGAQDTVAIESAGAKDGAVSIAATSASGGVSVQGGTHGSGSVEVASGTGGTYMSSTGALVGGFYGAVVTSYGSPGGTGDITLHSSLASVNVQAGEADAAAVSIEASHDEGGVMIQAATHAAGSVTVGAGTGGVSVMSTGKVDVASTQNSASAVHVRNTHASGGVTIEGVGTHASTVLLAATAENGGVTMQAPEDGGSVTVSSSTGGVSVGSSGTVAVDSTQASSSSVKITASHAEGGVLVGAQDTVAIESAGAKDGAVSITATSASGGVSVQGGTHGSGSVEVASGTGGTYMSSTGALVGGFYGAVVTSYGSPGGTGDITLHSSLASVNVQAGEADAAAVSIEASHDEGGVMIQAATHAAGSVTVGAGTGGVSVTSTDSISVFGDGKVDVASAQNSASAVHVRNTHASGGVTIEGVGTHASTVLLAATAENGGVTMQAPEDGGSVTVSSSTGGVSVGSSGTVAVDSTQASSSSVKITASHAEGGVLVGAQDTVAIESAGAKDGAVSITATSASGGVSVQGGTHGSGSVEVASGTGGTYMSSTGALVGGFYGAVVTSYGSPGGTGDITLHSSLASVNVQAGEADAAAVSIEASHDEGGVMIQAATHAAGSVTVGAGTGGVSVTSTDSISVFGDGKVDVASAQNSASAVHVRNTHASGGVTIEGVGTHASTVLLAATAENGGVTMQAPEDGGSVTVSSSTGGVSVGSSGTVAVDSTQASSSSVKITASHAEGGVLVGAQDTVAIESAGAKDGAVSITATSASGGVSVQGGTHGSGSVEVASGTGGTYMSSTGALVGGFYGAVVTSYGSPGGTGDITLHSSLASVNVQAGEADAAAVSIEASHDEGGVMIQAATHAAGSVTVGAGTGGVSVMSTGKVDVASTQNSASAVHVRNTHASGGVTIEGVGTHASTVLLAATAENGGVTMQAPEDGGSVTVSSSTGGVSVGSFGTVAVDSTQASSSSVKITASHAEGGVLVGAQDTVAIESAGAKDGAVSITATSASGGVSVQGGTHGSGSVEVASGTGGTYMSSTGALVGGFYGAVVTSYGSPGGTGDITLHSSLASVNVQAGEADAAAVSIEASHDEGGVMIQAATHAAGSVTVGAGTGGVSVTSTDSISVFGDGKVDVASAQNSASAVHVRNTHASGGVTIEGVGTHASTVLLAATAENGGVTMQAPEDGGSVTVSSSTGGVSVGSSGTVAVDSTQASSSSVKITASHAEGGVLVGAQDTVAIESAGAKDGAVSITATSASGGVSVQGGTHGSGSVEVASGTGGTYMSSTGALVGGFYGAVVTSYGSPGGTGDITLHSSLASVNVQAGEADAAAVSIEASHDEGGVMIQAATHAAGSVTVGAGTGGVSVTSTDSISVFGDGKVDVASAQNSASAVHVRNTHASGGVTIEGVGTHASTVLLTATAENGGVTMQAPEDGGSVTVSSSTGGVSVGSSGTVAVDSTQASSSSVKITASHAEGGVLVGAQDTVAIESAGAKDGAVSIAATSASGGVSVQGGTHGSGSVEVASGTGGTYMSSTGALVGGFYGAVVTSYGSPGGTGDITLHSSLASVNVQAGEADAAAVSIEASHDEGGVMIQAATHAAGSVTVGAGTGGVSVTSTDSISVFGDGKVDVASAQNSASAVHVRNTHASGGVTIEGVGTHASTVLLAATAENGGVTMQAPEDGGSVTVSSSTGGVSVGSSGTVAVDSTQASSSSVKITASHAEGGVLVGAQDTVAIESAGAKDGAVSITATSASGGVSVQGGTHGSGSVEVASGTGGTYMSSTGALVGGFYGAVVTSYGSPGGTGDITLHSSLASVNVQAGEADAAAVSIEASHDEGGVMIQAATHAAGSVTVGAGTGGVSVTSTDSISVFGDGKVDVASAQNSASAVHVRNTHASGGVTIEGVGTHASTVLLAATAENGGVTMQAPEDGGSVTVSSSTGGVSVGSFGTVAVDSTQASSSSVKITASHAEGGVLVGAQDTVAIESAGAKDGAVSITATSASGGVSVQGGTHGSGSVEVASGTGGTYMSSTGALVGGFYGAVVTSYGSPGGTGDITLHSSLASVNVQAGEADAAAVSIEASHDEGGVMIQAATHAAGSVTVGAGTGGVSVTSTDSISVFGDGKVDVASAQNSASAVHVRNTHASGGVTIEGVGTHASTVLLTATAENGGVTMQAPEDGGSVTVSSSTGGVSVGSSGTVAVDSTQASSSSVKITASHAEGGVLVGAQDTVAIESAGAKDGAVSITATSASGGVSVQGGTHGSGSVEVASGTGGTYMSSTGALVGGFYGAVVTSYGSPGGTGDITLHSSLASVNVQAGEADAAAVSIEASHDEGGVMIQAATHAAGSVTVGAGTGGVSVTSTDSISVFGDGKVDVASAQNSASAVHVRNTHASGGVTIEGVGTHASTVLLAATAENGGVTMQAPEDGGSVTVSSSTGGVSVGSSGTVAVDSTQASSSSVKITASHAEGGVLVGAQDTVAIESAGAKDGAVSITATSASGGVSVQGGTHGSGSVEVASGTGGTYMSSTGALVGGFYGAVVTSYGSPGGTGDIALHSSLASVNVQAGEADAAAVSIEASHDEGGVMIQAATHAAGSVTVGAGTGGVSVMSTGKVDVASAQNSASAVHVRNTHASGGVTIEGVGTHASTVLLTATAENGGVTMQAPEDGGSVTVSSSTGGVSVGSSGTVAVDSTQASSSSVKITASHAEGGVLVGAQDTVAIESAGAKDGAVSITATSASGGVSVQGGTHGSGSVEVASGTGGTYMSSTGALVGGFYGAVVTSYGSPGGTGDIALHSTLASVNVQAGEADAAAVSIEASHDEGGVMIQAATHAAGSVTVGAGTGGVSVMSTGKVDVASAQNSASAVHVRNTHASGGVTIEGVGTHASTVLLTATAENGGVTMQAPEDGGSVTVSSSTGGVSVGSSGTVAVDSTQASSSSVKITASHAEGGVLVGAQDTVAIESAGAKDGAVSITATSASGGVSVQGGTHGSGSVEVASGTGGTYMSSTGALVGGFYGAVVTSYGSPGGTGDITLHSSIASLNLRSGEKSYSSVSIEALDEDGGISLDAASSSRGRLWFAAGDSGIIAKTTGQASLSSSSVDDESVLIKASSTSGGVRMSSSGKILLDSSLGGGVTIGAGTAGSGSIDATSGLGGTLMTSTGSFVGGFYGASITSYGGENPSHDVNIHSVESSVNIKSGGTDAASVYITASSDKGGITAESGSGGMSVVTKGDYTSASTGMTSLTAETDISLGAGTAGSGSIDATSGLGGTLMTSTGSFVGGFYGASITSYGGENPSHDVNIHSVESSVNIKSGGTDAASVYITASSDKGGITAESGSGGMSVVTKGDYTSASTGMTSLTAETDISLGAGTAGSGSIDATSGLGGTLMTSTGSFVGGFYGASITSYGGENPSHDVNIHSVESSVNIKSGGTDAASVYITASSDKGGITAESGSGGMSVVTKGDYTSASTGMTSLTAETDISLGAGTAGSGSIDATSGLGGTLMTSTGSFVGGFYGASITSYGGENPSHDVNIHSVESSVNIKSGGTDAASVYITASSDKGGITAESGSGGMSVVTKGDYTSASTGMTSLTAETDISLGAGTAGSGSIDATSGLGGTLMTSTGSFVGGFYGASITSYGGENPSHDVNIHSVESSVNIKSGGTDAASVYITASSDKGGITAESGSGGMSVVTKGDYTSASTGMTSLTSGTDGMTLTSSGKLTGSFYGMDLYSAVTIFDSSDEAKTSFGSSTSRRRLLQTNDALTYSLYTNGGAGFAKNVHIGGKMDVAKDVILQSDANINGDVFLGDATSDAITSQGTFKHTMPDNHANAAVFREGSTPYLTFTTSNGQEKITSTKPVTITDSTAASTATTGALIVTGGVGVSAASNFGGVVTVSDTTTSGANNAGALIVAGGVGIAENLNVGGNTALGDLASADTLTITGAVTLNLKDNEQNAFLITEGANNYMRFDTQDTGGELIVAVKPVTVSDTTTSGANNAGALIVAGGVGIAENLNVGGNTALGDLASADTLTITGAVTLNLKDNEQNAFLITEGANNYMRFDTQDTGGELIVAVKPVTVSDTTTSGANNAGALIVAGGVGIAENLNVGGNTALGDLASADTLTITGAVTLNLKDNEQNAFLITEGANNYMRFDTQDTGGELIVAVKPVTVSDTTTSGANNAGALIVAGGVGIAENLNVGGNTALGDLASADTLTITGAVTLNLKDNEQNAFLITEGANNYMRFDTQDTGGELIVAVKPVTVSDTTTSGANNAGALIVAGGVGIAENLNVGGNTALGDLASADTLTITGAVTLNLKDNEQNAFLITEGANNYMRFDTQDTGGELIVAVKPVTVSDTTTSGANNAGALIVAGGVGIAENLNVGGNTALGDLASADTLTITGAVTLNLKDNEQNAFLITEGANNYMRFDTQDTGGELIVAVKPVTVSDTTTSGANNAGALIVAGGVGIAENLNVGGNTALGDLASADTLTITGAVTLNLKDNEQNAFLITEGANNYMRFDTQDTGGELIVAVKPVTVSDTTTSGANNAGALIVAGGVGIAENLNVGGNTALGDLASADTLTITGAVTLNLKDNEQNAFLITEGANNYMRFDTQDTGGELIVAVKPVTVSDTTTSGANNAGAVVVMGGVGIAENLNMGGVLDVDGNTVLGDAAGTDTVTMNAIATVSSTAAATSSADGALIVSGGIGVALNSFFGAAVNVAGALSAGTAGTAQGVLTLNRGAGGNTPGHFVLVDTGGASHYYFADTSGNLRVNNAAPTADGDGTVVGTQTRRRELLSDAEFLDESNEIRTNESQSTRRLLSTMLGNTNASIDDNSKQIQAATMDEMAQRLSDVEARSVQLQSENQYFKNKIERMQSLLCQFDAKLC